MNKSDIEHNARDLQLQIWRRIPELWPGKTGISFVEIFDAEVAARVQGIDFQYHPELKWFTNLCNPLEEVAGILHREECRIMVSTKFPLETRRFTAAHEIGHWRLHHGMNMHRDRPIEGLSVDSHGRAPEEREADYFAACFLMPRKRVMAAFEHVFSTKIPLVFDDAAAFELCPQDPDSLMRPYEGSLNRALALASATHFRGKYFRPLHQQLRVSVTSMAIRITELGLIRE